MRSYYDHLRQVQDTFHLNDKKPTFRASAIFPALHTKEISTCYIFLSYWMIKRHIPEITCLTTLRSEKGATIVRKKETINQAKAYRIELLDLLQDKLQDFIGSVEIEFFSTRPLIYPFPAVTINFYGPHFSSVVHTAQRIYNDFEDMSLNNQQMVPEGGFNVFQKDEVEPYITLINGPIDHQSFKIHFELINHLNESLQFDWTCDALSPYEMKMLYPLQLIDNQDFLKNHPGTLKLEYSLAWVYPRLIVGNLEKNHPALSLTHSYYDCSKEKGESNYWFAHQEDWFQASLMLPVKVMDGYFTNITFYPIYSLSTFFVDLEVYNAQGEKLLTHKEILQFRETNTFTSLSINDICKNLPKEESLSIKLNAYSPDNFTIPTRIKVSLDMGMISKGLPSNICTNFIPFNPSLQEKRTNLHWLPILANQKTCSAWILNNSPKKDFSESIDVLLTFYREIDTETFVKNILLQPHGHFTIDPTKDLELALFLKDQIGWCTISSSNPYLSTYYFTENPSGTIGGDHGY